MNVPAPEALRAAWGLCGPILPVAERENAVFRATLADGRAVALRLHRAGYRSAGAIAAELEWAARLSAAGVRCPAPVRTSGGEWLAIAPDGRRASVVSWVEGQPMRPDPARFEALGAAVARLHAAADAMEAPPPVAAFPRWDTDALLGETPIWGRFWESPSLAPDERRRLGQARDEMRARLADMGADRMGLIHADLLADNVLDDSGALWLIDFDDCGIGYRAYDLATALVSHHASAEYGAYEAALLGSYAAGGGVAPVTQGDVRLFVALRALASCGWAASRTPEGDPRRRAYAERALRLCERIEGVAT